MEVTGKLIGIQQNPISREYTATLTINEPDRLLADYGSLSQEEKLSIEVKKWRKKRSLDANAYCWVLLSKLATVHNSSKEEIYEEMLRRYGEPYKDDDGYITITVKSSVDMDKIDGHWLLIKESEKWKSYMMVKGSSEYETAEMARFIDGVVSECKESGIETLTPDELNQMKNAWHS